MGIKKSYSEVFRLSIEEFENYIKNFEKAFSSFDYSKIKIGKMRRNLVEYFISNLDSLKDKEELELVDKLSQVD